MRRRAGGSGSPAEVKEGLKILGVQLRAWEALRHMFRAHGHEGRWTVQ